MTAAIYDCCNLTFLMVAIRTTLNIYIYMQLTNRNHHHYPINHHLNHHHHHSSHQHFKVIKFAYSMFTHRSWG
jgi:hypothetical protein